jgi:aminoglycoside 6'-N-acetyltransferase
VESRVLIEKEDLVIRRMLDVDEDYDRMVRWRNRPHVRRWWDVDEHPLTVMTAVDEYRPDTRPGAASTACIVEREGRPVGFMQFYRWSSYAAEAKEVGIPFDDRTWGIDVFVGEPDEIGRGLGTRMMELLCGYLESAMGASAVVLTTAVDNTAAIKCYRKAGFRQVAEVLDTDTRDGERIKSWLMIRGDHPGAPEDSATPTDPFSVGTQPHDD